MQEFQWYDKPYPRKLFRHEQKERGDEMPGMDREELIHDNRQISIRLEAAANRAMAQKGLTSVQAYILLQILRHHAHGTSPTALQRETGVSKSALSGLVKQLRAKGYVRVEPCAGDERRKILFSTEKGEQVQEFLRQTMQRTCDQLYRDFSEAELAALNGMQKKMPRNLPSPAKHSA